MLVRAFILALMAAVFSSPAVAEKFITLVGTTSTENSGLYEKILPLFIAKTGIHVRVVSVGTGRAINIARNGDADILLVHHRPSEDKFMAEGYGVKRFDVMANDFIIVGPENDPAGIQGIKSVGEGLARIAAGENAFISRADDSGTHKKELSLWDDAGQDPATLHDWYKPVGAGMGAALNTAAGMGAYIMSDRASWLNFGNKGDLALLFSGDAVLFNQYAYLPVNPEKHGHVKHDLAMKLEDWLVSDTAKTLIDGYTIDGETLFVFNAKAAD